MPDDDIFKGKVRFNDPNTPNSKWDFVVEETTVRERNLAGIFCFAKLEMAVEYKSELTWSERTKNIAVEIECNGKASGMLVTEADQWVFAIHRDGRILCHLMFETEELRGLAWRFRHRTKMVGDRKAARVILIPLSAILDPVDV